MTFSYDVPYFHLAFKVDRADNNDNKTLIS